MKIYVLGDSISMHYGPYLKEYLRGVCDYARKEGEEEALLNLDKPQGANGGDSGMCLAFLEGKARTGGIDADYLLLNCGLHDIKTDPKTGAQQVAIEQYEKNLKAILKVVAKLKLKSIWVRTTPCDEQVHNRGAVAFHRFAADNAAYNRISDRVMAAAGVPIIDLHAFTVNLGPEPYCDHVHFHEHIRRQQAAFIAGWLGRFMGE